MRPFVFFFTFFSFFSAAALVARAEIINSQDKRIFYTNNWNNIESPGGPFSYIRHGPGTATLKVSNATRIAATVMVDSPGQKVQISLDGQVYDVSPTTPLQPVWTSSVLDPSVPHTVVVTKVNPDGQYTSLYSFLVTYPDSLTNTTDTVPLVPDQSISDDDDSSTSSPPPTSSAVSAQQYNTEPILSGAKLAGVIVGCIAALVLIIGIVLYRRRMVGKRKAASTAYWEYITTRAQQPPGPQFPPTPPEGSFDGAEAKEMP